MSMSTNAASASSSAGSLWSQPGESQFAGVATPPAPSPAAPSHSGLPVRDSLPSMPIIRPFEGAAPAAAASAAAAYAAATVAAAPSPAAPSHIGLSVHDSLQAMPVIRPFEGAAPAAAAASAAAFQAAAPSAAATPAAAVSATELSPQEIEDGFRNYGPKFRRGEGWASFHCYAVSPEGRAIAARNYQAYLAEYHGHGR